MMTVIGGCVYARRQRLAAPFSQYSFGGLNLAVVDCRK